MTTATAWVDGEFATTEEILDRDALLAWDEIRPRPASPAAKATTGTLQPWGAHEGDIFVAGPYVAVVDKNYLEAAQEALRLLFAQDERVRSGNYYTLGIH